MSVDVFGVPLRGSVHAQRGKAGVAGIVDMVQWMPNSLLESLQRHDEIGCFFIENATDIQRKDSNIVQWN